MCQAENTELNAVSLSDRRQWRPRSLTPRPPGFEHMQTAMKGNSIGQAAVQVPPCQPVDITDYVLAALANGHRPPSTTQLNSSRVVRAIPVQGSACDAVVTSRRVCRLAGHAHDAAGRKTMPAESTRCFTNHILTGRDHSAITATEAGVTSCCGSPRTPSGCSRRSNGPGAVSSSSTTSSTQDADDRLRPRMEGRTASASRPRAARLSSASTMRTAWSTTSRMSTS